VIQQCLLSLEVSMTTKHIADLNLYDHTSNRLIDTVAQHVHVLSQPSSSQAFTSPNITIPITTSGARQLKELTLTTPIRYSANDPVEKWMNNLLCLDVAASSTRMLGTTSFVLLAFFFISLLSYLIRLLCPLTDHCLPTYCVLPSVAAHFPLLPSALTAFSTPPSSHSQE
jgi:hypothetical protein